MWCGATQTAQCVTFALPSPSLRLERRLLGNVRYFNDLIVTHEDEEYMRRCCPCAYAKAAVRHHICSLRPLPGVQLLGGTARCDAALPPSLQPPSTCQWQRLPSRARNVPLCRLLFSCRNYTLRLEDRDMYFIRTDPADRCACC